MYNPITIPALRCGMLCIVPLLADRAAAICTGWEQPSSFFEPYATVTGDTNAYVDWLACPSGASGGFCTFDRKSYNITGERRLQVQDQDDELNLPVDETEAIWKLAQDGFNTERNHSVNYVAREFLTLHSVITTSFFRTETEYADTDLLQVKAGYNKTLYFLMNYMGSFGVLSNCSNETLNGLSISARAPWMAPDPTMGNATVIHGVWESALANTTDASGTDSGGRMAISVDMGRALILALMVTCFVI